MFLWLLRRVLGGALVVFATMIVTAATAAVLVPDAAPRPGLGGTAEGVRRMLHGDFGVSGVVPGSVTVRTLFERGVQVDLALLAGGLVSGTLVGLAGGLFCAARPRSPAARGLEALATVLFCTPVYLVALSLLLLFEPTFGSLAHVHGFLEPGRFTEPQKSLWHWFQAMLVPWVLVGIPVAAAVLRLTAAQTIENLDRDYVQTAAAAGLRRRRVIRHAARPTYTTTAAFLGTQVRPLVLNMMFVEYVFFLPGFLWYTKRAIGSDPPLWTRPDIPTLEGIAIWTAVLVVTLGLLSDAAVLLLEPRVRPS